MQGEASIEALPQYLRYTAFGELVQKALRVGGEDVPDWVTSSLIFNPMAPPPDSKPQMAPPNAPTRGRRCSNESQCSDTDVELGDSDNDEGEMDYAPGDVMFNPSYFVGDSRRIWLNAQAEATRSNRASASAPHQLPSASQPQALPSAWDLSEKASNVTVHDDTLQISTDSRETSELCLRSNHPIPLSCGMYYFEVSISPTSYDRPALIGICTDTSHIQYISSSDNESWGYFSDDGRVISPHGSAHKFGPSYGPGDVIGCGVNLRTNTVFYTKNGYYIGQAFKNVKANKLHPLVGVRSGVAFTVNFGARGFRYDIVKHVMEEKRRVFNLVDATENATYPDVNKTILEVLEDYFEHAGYRGSASALRRAIAGESKNGNVEMIDVDNMQDEEAERRQRLRQGIIDRDLDLVYKELETHYPNVLKCSSALRFSLDCLRFAQAAIDPANLDEALVLGQKLRARYDEPHNTQTAQKLRSLLSLLAYPEPKDKAAQFVGPQAWAELAERVNSAIMASQGVFDVARLPKLVEHTTSSVERLAAKDATAAFINVPEDLLL